MTRAYKTTCNTCGIPSTIVTRGKWQCQHCGAENNCAHGDAGAAQ